MQQVRLTRRQQARLLRRLQLRPPPTSKQHPPLLRLPHRRRHQLAHPARPRNRLQVRSQVLARSRAQVRSPVLALNLPLTQHRPRHQPTSKMNCETMSFVVGGCPTLVGRGSRTAKKCFRSSRRSHALGSVSPRDAPSSRIMVCHPLELGPDFRIVFPCSSRPVWLGERVSLAHNAVGTNLMPCDYRLAVREPRPTKVGATNHKSLITNHFSRLRYVCS